jgi:hypothetical protein
MGVGSVKEGDLGQLENHIEQNQPASIVLFCPANVMTTQSPISLQIYKNRMGGRDCRL